ncbi:MAG TPA: HEAT repeat domain-containing protein [Polyangiales bacterium]|nr:HEAT repeat domain-containing protein [Polyangiales bacterium]
MVKADASALAELLALAVDEAKALTDSAEAELRLVRLSDLCAQVPGQPMVDALVRILDEENPAVRVQAAEALVDVAYDRYVEVARAIERSLDQKLEGPAMRELPWVLAEVGEPSAAKLISRFLTQDTAEIVASAIEALAQLGDPSAVPALRKLQDDAREVTMDDGHDEQTTTIGDLASEAVEALSG